MQASDVRTKLGRNHHGLSTVQTHTAQHNYGDMVVPFVIRPRAEDVPHSVNEHQRNLACNPCLPSPHHAHANRRLIFDSTITRFQSATQHTCRHDCIKAQSLDVYAWFEPLYSHRHANTRCNMRCDKIMQLTIGVCMEIVAQTASTHAPLFQLPVFNFLFLQLLGQPGAL